MCAEIPTKTKIHCECWPTAQTWTKWQMGTWALCVHCVIRPRIIWRKKGSWQIRAAGWIFQETLKGCHLGVRVCSDLRRVLGGPLGFCALGWHILNVFLQCSTRVAFLEKRKRWMCLAPASWLTAMASVERKKKISNLWWLTGEHCSNLADNIV